MMSGLGWGATFGVVPDLTITDAAIGGLAC